MAHILCKLYFIAISDNLVGIKIMGLDLKIHTYFSETTSVLYYFKLQVTSS